MKSNSLSRQIVIFTICCTAFCTLPSHGQNSSPAISAIPDQVIAEETSAGPIAFTVADTETPASNLTVSAGSSNPAMVPVANIVLGGSGNNRIVKVTPATNQFGTAMITVTVSDSDGASASTTFTMTVTSVNDPPTLDPLPDMTIQQNAAPQRCRCRASVRARLMKHRP